MHASLRLLFAVAALLSLASLPSIPAARADDLTNCKDAVDQTQQNNTAAAILYGLACGITLNNMLHPDQGQQQEDTPAGDTPRWPPNPTETGDRSIMAHNHASWFTDQNLRDCLTAMVKGSTVKNNVDQDVAASKYLYCYQQTPEQVNAQTTMHILAAQSMANFDSKNDPWWVNVTAGEIIQQYTDLQNTPTVDLAETAGATFTLSNGKGVMHVTTAYAFTNGQLKPGGGSTVLTFCTQKPVDCSSVTSDQLPKVDQETVKYLAAADLDMIKIHMSMRGIKLDLTSEDQPQQTSDGWDALTPENVATCFDNFRISPHKSSNSNPYGTNGDLVCTGVADTTSSTHYSMAQSEVYTRDTQANDGSYPKGYIKIEVDRDLTGGDVNEREEEFTIDFTSADGASLVREDRRAGFKNDKPNGQSGWLILCKNVSDGDCTDLKGPTDLANADLKHYEAVLPVLDRMFKDLVSPPPP